MKSGALAGTPWRRSSITCPSSWTKIRSTKPIANGSPQSQRVGRDRDEHRRAGRDDLELEQEAAELDEQEPERDDRREQLPHERRRAPARLHGLVAALAVLDGLRIGQRLGLRRLARLRTAGPGSGSTTPGRSTPRLPRRPLSSTAGPRP